MSDTVESLNAALSDRYRVDGELGRGGMGTVFRAEDLRHGRQVALKVVDPALVHAVGAERFLQEIRIAATLQHPHILPLFDSGEAGGHLYYAMPFVEGRSLRELLQDETQLSVSRATRIAREVAGGLAQAHAKGIVHRDIKPENILLYGGHAVLADFGVASALSQAGGDKLTPSGLAVGTPSYMAPEQMREDGKVDGRADLYALGCVLYEMLVGDPPFMGATATVVMARHAADPVPPISTVRSTVPPALESVVMRCLAKVPADRYESGEELVTALEGVDMAATASPAEAETAAPSPGAPASGPGRPSPGGPEGPSGQAPRPHTPPGGTPRPGEARSFLQELKRRNVYKAAVVYGVVALSLVQGAQLAFPTFDIEWAFDFVVMAAVLGFPLVLVLAWVYDLTRHGIRKTTPWGTPPPEAVAAAAARRRRGALGVLGGLGLIAYVALYPFGYGETTIPLDPTEAEARRTVEQFLAAQGAVGSFREARHVHRFSRNLEYLQRSVGFVEARGLAAERVPAWEWHFRWFRPGEEEDWDVYVASGGQIKYFRRGIPDTTPGADLEEEQAEEVAQAFLRERGWDVEALERVQAASRRLAERTDHTFVWHVPDLAITWADAEGERGEGIVEVTAQVQGDRVGLYRTRFDIPQTFLREASRRSAISSGLQITLLVATWVLAVILLVVLGRRGRIEVRWRGPLTVAAVTAGAVAVHVGLSTVPAEQVQYSTETPWALFLGGQLLLVAFGGLVFGLIAVPLAAGTEAFGRLVWAERMEGWTNFFRGRLRDPGVARDLRYGFVLAGFLLGWAALSQAVQVRVPDVWGLVTWGGVEHAGDLLPILSLPFTAGVETLMGAEALLGVLFLATALAILCRYLKSAAAAVMLVAVVTAVLTTQGTYPLYVSATLGAVEVLLAAAALVAFGPLVVLAGLYVSLTVGKAVPFLLLGDPGSLVVGLTALAFALLPAVPTFLARTKEDESEGEEIQASSRSYS